MRDSALAQEVLAAKPIELASTLVQIPSHRGLPRQEAAVVEALRIYLEAHGLEPRVEEVCDGRPNLLCTVDSGLPGRHLVLCGHTDTVPLNEGDEGVGFSGRIDEGLLYGRGAVDMKGSVAAMAAALVALHRSRTLPGGRVTLAAVIDEEMESLGAERLVETGMRADGALVGEPTGNRICLGHKGLEWLEITFHGRAAHGGTPQAGINAVVAAAHFVTLVEEELQPRLRERADDLLGPPTLNFGTIQGGDQPSTVAAYCVLRADRRSVPGETYPGMVAELEALLRRVEQAVPGIQASVARMAGGMATLEHVALKTAASEPLVAAAVAARQAHCGEAGAFGTFPAWTDGALLSAFAGMPTIVLGPGDLALAHSPRESVPTAELIDAANLFALTAWEFCRG